MFRTRKYVLISLILLTLVALLASMGNVHATTTRLIKEHHPASTFTDPSGTVDGYFIGQTVIWHIHVNVTASTAPFRWLSISNLTITDTLPNLLVSGPLYMTYVSGSQNSSSALGAATFTDFGNGTLLWNFGAGPFTTGVLAPPPFSNANDFYMASVTFNATILGTVPDNTFLTNTCAVSYTETVSGVHSAPGTSDTIWVPRPVLNIVKVNPAKVENGSNFNYVLQLSNTGHEDAVGVQVKDVMPIGVAHTPPATATSGTFLTDTSSDVVWTGMIPSVTSPVNTVNITIPVKANTALISVFNNASFTVFPSDTKFTSQSANCTTRVIHPAIGLTKTSSASKVEMGTNVTYTYNVTNTGDATLSGVSVTDNTFGTIASGQTLTAGQSMLFTKSAVLTANTTNVAVALGVDQTGVAVSATATATVNVIHPAISLTKTPSASKVENGSTVNYTYVVTNTGDTSLTVSLYDSVFGTIFTGKVLVAGASNTTVISQVLTANTTNLATATGVDQTGASAKANATGFVQVIHPAITLTKTPSPNASQTAPATFTYTYVVTNIGDVALSSVTVYDQTFNLFIVGPINLPVGGSASGTHNETYTAAGNYTDYANATGTDQIGVKVNAFANATVTVTPPSRPKITLTKTPSSTKVENGTKVTYTYNVTNTGDTTLTVSLVDNQFGTIYTGLVLAPGASNITTVSKTLLANTTNTATATGVDQTGASATATATSFVQVIHPAITLTKTPSASKVANGSTVNYTYVVTNTGDAALTVSLTDNVFGTIFTGKVLVAGASNTTVISQVLTTCTTCHYDWGCESDWCKYQCTSQCDCSGVFNVAKAAGVDQTGVCVKACATAFVQVIHPAIKLTKTACPVTSQGCDYGGLCGSQPTSQAAPATFVYTYTVTNTGDTTLTGITVFDQTLNVQITLGTTTLVPGQSTKGTYTKTYNSAGTYTNKANATGTDQLGGKVKAFANATVTVTPPVQTTRTWGFWKTHTCFTEYIFNHKLNDFIAIDSGTSHARNITSYAVLFGAFEADVAKMSNRTNRLAIDSARISLLHQLLAAILNTAAFHTTVPTDPVTGLNLIQAANIAYSGNNRTEMNRTASLLDTFNGSGDNIALPQGLPNPGNATPLTSIMIANIAFWNKL